jgi:hypothetical protein
MAAKNEPGAPPAAAKDAAAADDAGALDRVVAAVVPPRESLWQSFSDKPFYRPRITSTCSSHPQNTT